MYFCPDDIKLIKDNPVVRRNYINIELCQLYPDYLLILKEYQHFLKQRNDYLKSLYNNKIDNIYLNILKNSLIDLNKKINFYRFNYIKEVNKFLGDIYFELTEIKGLKLKYISDFESVDKFIILFDKNLENDMKYKYTQYGIHRDNFVFILNNENILYSGSQGQMRLAVLSLKLAELMVMVKNFNIKPIILLDDIFSELDMTRKNKIMKFLNNDLQKIITTTDISFIDDNNLKYSKIIKLDKYKGKDDN